MKKRKNSSGQRRLVHSFYRGNRIAFCLALLSSLMIGLVNLALSWLIQQLTDVISGRPGTRTLLELTGFTGIIIVSIIGSKLLLYVSKPRFMKKAMMQYRADVFERLTGKGIAAFRRETTALYLSALSNDLNSIEMNYLEQQFTFVTYGVMFVGAFVMMLLYSPQLTGIAVLLSVLPFLASVHSGSRLEAAEQQVSGRNEAFTGILQDLLNGFSVVKSFKAEKEIRARMNESSEAAERAKCRRRKIDILLGMNGSVAGALAQMGVFLAGAYLAAIGRTMTPGMVVTFVNLMNFVITPIAELPSLLANRRAALGLIGKLADALETDVSEDGAAVLPELKEGIRVERLSFSYEEGAQTLQDISVNFEAGKSYAVVGASGSGKSTFLNLLMGSGEDYTGTIRYDGQELRKISRESLYDVVSMIQQKVFVFNASIRDNITLFQKFDSAKIERALEQSGLSELIRQRGEDYLCGENGCNLSGGERQRISIARSLLRETPVLLVDEAAAALDKETAGHVMDAILELSGLTRIIVTHALEAAQMKKYDGILVMKNGRLAEYGDFTALMEKKGYFYSLFMVGQ